MRENLFRGKRLDNGEWAEGGLVLPNRELPDGAGLFLEGKAFLCADLYSIRVDDYDKKTLELAGFVEVDPETVGQYIGLTDKNGRKIFAGDILHFWSEYRESFVSKCVVKYGRFNCPCCDGVYGWFLDGGDIRYFEDGETSYVICGNIHDNPELLKGGAT